MLKEKIMKIGEINSKGKSEKGQKAKGEVTEGY